MKYLCKNNCGRFKVDDAGGNGTIIITVIYNMNTTPSAGCPTAVSITTSTGPFSAGDELTCSSNGFPEPSYRWTDSSGTVVSSTNIVTLPEGVFSLTCTATGNLPGQCSASDSISGLAKSKYRKQNDTLVTLFCCVMPLNAILISCNVYRIFWHGSISLFIYSVVLLASGSHHVGYQSDWRYLQKCSYYMNKR